MSHAGDKTRIWIGRIVKLVILLAVAYGAYWTYVNWDYIRHKGTKKYEVERYDILWQTNARYAKELAKEHKREIMLVYINSGANNTPSDTLIRTIFPSKTFQQAADTYVPLLCDVRQGVDEGAQVRNNQSELIKEYGLDTKYGMMLRLNAEGDVRERIQFTNQGSVDLINKLAGGKFVALKPIKRPELKDPVKDKVVEGAGKAKEMIDSEGTITPETPAETPEPAQ